MLPSVLLNILLSTHAQMYSCFLCTMVQFFQIPMTNGKKSHGCLIKILVPELSSTLWFPSIYKFTLVDTVAVHFIKKTHLILLLSVIIMAGNLMHCGTPGLTAWFCHLFSLFYKVSKDGKFSLVF